MALAKNKTIAGNLNNLDLVRATAVMCVYFGHLIDFAAGSTSNITWHVAQLGVLIFFVHTSLVLMRSLDRDDNVPAFFVRRAFRIYPLVWVCVLTVFCLQIDGRLNSREWSLAEVASNLALTTNLTYTDNMLSVLWSLPIEVQMYLVLPVLFLGLRRRPLWVSVAVWLGSLPLALVQQNISSRLNVLSYAPCFIGGVIAWRLGHSVAARVDAAWWPLAFVASWPIFLLAPREGHFWYRWVFCLILGFMIPLFRDLPHNRLTHLICKYSYGIYLTHAPIGRWAFGLAIPREQQLALLVALTAALPVLLYHFVEHPAIQAGKRIATWSPQVAPPKSLPRQQQAA